MTPSISKITEKVRSYSPDADIEIINRAYEFASKAHQGQFRDSGEEYIQHPLAVARILADLELDVTTIAAGLLHDTIEDTQVTLEEINATFGPEIAGLVDGVTKLSRLDFKTKQEQQVENLRKMFVAMAKDIRVIMIKLADRLHNMRTLKHLPPERQRKISTETLEIYAPLAHRLGMWTIKWELEDLAFRYLEPEEYYKLVELVAAKRREREGYIQRVQAELAARLAEYGIKAEVAGRPKHLYSIYRKMKDQGKAFSEIYDLLAIRVIVQTVKECYEVLGIVHTLWKPIHGRFKDYIAMPKSNMYQSLHTTVIGPNGEPLEIQIRTEEMHRTAEYGIAAHWRYKEGTTSSSDFEEKISWLRQILEWQKDLKDVDEFMETLKIDLFADEVYVFTPKGDVKNLVAGSTPVDFAYAVHTDIGTHCVGAKVNGRIVPLDWKLKNGDIVEILTSKTGTPSRDWLKFVKTSKAKSKIRAWFREAHRAESIAKGKEALEKEIKRLGEDPAEHLKDDGKLTELAKRFGMVSAEDLLAAIGYGKVSLSQAVTKLLPEKAAEAAQAARAPKLAEPKKRPSKGVRVKGVDNVLVRFSKCCNPVPGDEIVGYITRGRGVSVHRADCPNVAALAKEPEREIHVEWEADAGSSYPVEIEVEAYDRVALLSNLMNAIADMKTNIAAVNARTTKKNKMAIISLVLEINNVQHMDAIMRRLKAVNGVIEVHRANPT